MQQVPAAAAQRHGRRRRNGWRYVRSVRLLRGRQGHRLWWATAAVRFQSVPDKSRRRRFAMGSACAKGFHRAHRLRLMHLTVRSQDDDVWQRRIGGHELSNVNVSNKFSVGGVLQVSGALTLNELTVGSDLLLGDTLSGNGNVTVAKTRRLAATSSATVF